MSRHADEGFGRSATIRHSADFLRCYRRGRRRHSPLAVLHIHANEAAAARLGITASRKVGKAVVRHRTKRRIREIFRRWPGRGRLPGVDIVVHLKPNAGDAPFSQLKSEIERMLRTLVEGKEDRR